MNSKEILYSDGNNDECYTQAYCVKPILKYIPKDWIVWCPFDTEESNFVKLISKQNKVIHSHISEGKDFYKYQPDEYWDCIISNPPFSGKRKIFERALSFDKPFALIMTNAWFNDSAICRLFKDKDLQLLMFEERMKFVNNGKVDNKITFSSSYFCYNFLPKQIIMDSLKNYDNYDFNMFE